MAVSLTASMPQFAALPYGAEIVLEAINPTTGGAVTGVVFNAVSIWADVTPLDTTQTGGVTKTVLVRTGVTNG